MRDQAPTTCFLMETRLDREGFNKHCRELPFPNKFIIKKPYGGGGLALIWKNEVKMEVINFTNNHILARVEEEDGFVWMLTCFYGWPKACQKPQSWALLNHLRSIVDGPWCCVDDFNAILHSSEKKSKYPPQFKQMDDFRNLLDDCRLADLGFVGYPYAWNNKRPGLENTQERLDRVVANTGWREKFHASSVLHLFSHAFDHRPLLLLAKSDLRHRGKSTRSFRFEEAWLMRADCEEVITEAWGSVDSLDSGLRCIKKKISRCGSILQAWGASDTNPDVAEIKRVQKKVEELSMAELTEANKSEFLVASKILDDLLLKQEFYWAQRSRVAWLKHGDKNTKFFHSKASQRQRRNFIHGVRDNNNIWVEEPEEVADVAIDDFESIFHSGSCRRMEDCLDAVQQKVTPAMQEVLSSTFIAEEIKTALFQMGPTKALGPDNMNALFYQKYWHVVGDDMIAAVLDFLNSGNMIPEINYTHIVLIPKVKFLEKNSDFRPISLCNVIYKIISKVLANKLKQILP